MLRIGLSLYLMLSTLAGPALCCCVSERLVQWFTHPLKQDVHKPGCCPLDHHTPIGQQHHAPNHEQDHPDRPSCPCQEDGSRQVALHYSDSELARQLQGRNPFQGSMEILPALPAAALLPLSVEESAPRELLRLPFLSAQDLLRVLHRLRC